MLDTNQLKLAIDEWLAKLGDEYAGPIAPEHLKTGMRQGWRIRWREHELQIQIDPDFPDSAPRVYLVGYDRAHAQPHIEKDGKVCLAGDAASGNGLTDIKDAVADAIKLLSENRWEKHEEDFREDFGNYWLSWATNANLSARILPEIEQKKQSGIARVIQTANQIFLFPSKSVASTFWSNLSGKPPRRVKTAMFIYIDPLPAPSRYPSTAAELWALVEARSTDGPSLLTRLIQNDRREAFVVLSGMAPSGRFHFGGMRIFRPLDKSGRPLHRRIFRGGVSKSEHPQRTLFERFSLERLPTSRLDASSTRMPDGARNQLALAKVIVVGCGALGSGVARMLAQSGVQHIDLVDPETLGWENIRRHELGARLVGHSKAGALAAAISGALPMISHVRGYKMTFATFAREHPAILAKSDLVISCTGSWSADSAVQRALSKAEIKASAVYGWMEGHALASHAVHIAKPGPSLLDGFDDQGVFRSPVSAGGKPPPADCGGSTTPFGAVELSHAQSLVSGLAVDVLRAKRPAEAWRTWIATAAAFEDAQATVAPGWIAEHGLPKNLGGLVSHDWKFL